MWFLSLKGQQELAYIDHFTKPVLSRRNNKDQVYIYSAERGTLSEHQNLLKGLQAFQDEFYLSIKALQIVFRCISSSPTKAIQFP